MEHWKPYWHIRAVPTEAFMDCARRARATSPGLARKRSALLLTIRARIKLRISRWMAQEQSPVSQQYSRGWVNPGICHWCSESSTIVLNIQYQCTGGSDI